jgi:hypothetical protein
MLPLPDVPARKICLLSQSIEWDFCGKIHPSAHIARVGPTVTDGSL